MVAHGRRRERAGDAPRLHGRSPRRSMRTISVDGWGEGEGERIEQQHEESRPQVDPVEWRAALRKERGDEGHWEVDQDEREQHAVPDRKGDRGPDEDRKAQQGGGAVQIEADGRRDEQAGRRRDARVKREQDPRPTRVAQAEEDQVHGL
eukprot:2196041-Prymnesium_polylepis.1